MNRTQFFTTVHRARPIRRRVGWSTIALLAVIEVAFVGAAIFVLLLAYGVSRV
jgi:hypothetical protein